MSWKILPPHVPAPGAQEKGTDVTLPCTINRALFQQKETFGGSDGRHLHSTCKAGACGCPSRNDPFP